MRRYAMEVNGNAPAKDPDLPAMGRLGEVACPRAPQTIDDAGLEDGTLIDLAVKFAYTINRFNGDWLVERMHVAPALAAAVTQQMLTEGLIEETMMTMGGKPTYRVTERGRRHAERAMEVCAYLGPAPVSLEAYSAMLRGDVWIPHCVAVRNSVIRLFDEQVHERVEIGGDKAAAIDQRWVRVRRPMVVVGGELTLEYLDLVYSPSLRYYEAPPHLKANGGVFLVDDFGRERVSPHQLLNRFITPMEHRYDYFTLVTGQKIQVPLRHVLIIATNLGLETVTDPAFLRRMGYRLCLEQPNPERYAQIFTAYAERQGAAVDPEALEGLLQRYRAENRELRACEPRDLIERARDICRFHGRRLELSAQVLDLAWAGYFGV